MNNDMTIAHLAVEYWRLLKALERTIDRLPHEHVAKTTAQLRFSNRKFEYLLKEFGLNLVMFDGQKYEPNVPVTAINADDFTDGEDLTIESTLEPTLVKNMNVLLLGKVVLKKFEEETPDVSGN